MARKNCIPVSIGYKDVQMLLYNHKYLLHCYFSLLGISTRNLLYVKDLSVFCIIICVSFNKVFHKKGLR